MFIGVYVVKGETGARLSFLRALARSFAKILSAIILGIGFLMAAFTKKKQGLHDIMTDAVVLKTSRANKYRTILTIILGTIGPALFVIFVMPIIMVAMVGLMLTGTMNPDFGDVEFTGSDFTQEYEFEPSAVALTATQMDELMATTSIQQMLKSDPENFAEGYTTVGPVIVACNPEYYGVLSVYLPDFEGLNEDELVSVAVTEVRDVKGVDVLDKFVADVPVDLWPKGYMAGESYVFAYDARKSFAIQEGTADEDIRAVSGVIQFKTLLENGETYERSYDFTLQYQTPVE
ncbi:MAG: hypothetical protein RL538_819 [Candidatus Parcubacteria bacterium]|jgi:hypothetical protein